MNAVLKYLENYSEKEVSFSCSVTRKFDACVVVPAHLEGENLFKFFRSLEAASHKKNILCILVLNGKKKHEKFHQNTLLQLNALHPVDFQLIIVDRATGENIFEEKEGVGLARKIGCDLALKLITENKISSPWIRSTDADVLLPLDYFDDWQIPTTTSAFLYSFFHETEATENRSALEVYEESLHYYVWGLKFANSPYAFHTIGSTLSIHFEKYAEVRGFPKLEAGEDFYILNKLAKVGNIEASPTSPLQLSGRTSNRTPFGTGAGIQKILQSWKNRKEFLFYHPDIFCGLKIWLQELQAYEGHLSLTALKRCLDDHGELGNQCIASAEALSLFTDLERLPLRPHNPSINRRHLQTWFDAFKTLKFLHTFRDLHKPSISYLEALYLAESMGYKSFICKPPRIMKSALT